MVQLVCEERYSRALLGFSGCSYKDTRTEEKKMQTVRYNCMKRAEYKIEVKREQKKIKYHLPLNTKLKKLPFEDLVTFYLFRYSFLSLRYGRLRIICTNPDGFLWYR